MQRRIDLQTATNVADNNRVYRARKYAAGGERGILETLGAMRQG